VTTITSRESRRASRPSGTRNTDITAELRSEYERDVDRLLYTYYFRRLAETTQVGAPGGESAAIGMTLQHNRITHSLKVGQVGRRFAQYLLADRRNATGIEAAGGLDPNVVQAAGLAHDLGHPPFGHIGEDTLDEVARHYGLADGFEGNAQTFRILVSLIAHQPVGDAADPVEGLDLTRAATAACMKYPWGRSETGKRWRKYGFYDVDWAKFDDIVAPLLRAENTACLEAELMDWADDVSYAVHDIEDFALNGLIPISTLAHTCDNPQAPESERIYRALFPDAMHDFWSYAEMKLREIGKTPSPQARRQFQKYAATLLPRTVLDGGRNDEARMSRITSHIINEASKATSVHPDGTLRVVPAVRDSIEVFKQLTWFYVIDGAQLVAVQRGQHNRLERLVHGLVEWAEHAFREFNTERWRIAPEPVGATESWANRRALPRRLDEFVSALLARNDGRGAYPDRRLNIVRGVIDYVASLRESDVENLCQRLSLAGLPGEAAGSAA
jgi:dGTPase